jgi:hypothetical protein
MDTQVKQGKKELEVKRYQIQYPASAYVYPTDARIHDVRFDDEHINLGLMDGRSLSIPLWWIPSLHNASPKDREMYTINRSRTMLLWDPDKCAINDELRVTDYLGTT